MENIFCPKCGSKQEGNSFCTNCGNKLSYTEAPEVPSISEKVLLQSVSKEPLEAEESLEAEEPTNIEQETDRELEPLLSYLYGFTKVVIVLIYTFFASWVFYKLVPETLRRSDPLDFIPIAGIKFDLPVSLPYDLVGGLMLIINEVIPIVILLSIVIKFFSKYKFSDIFLWLSILAISLYTIFVGTSI